MRVAFVDQTGAEAGGAEESLTLLLEHLPADIVPTVLLFRDGAFADRLRSHGFAVEIFPVAAVVSESTRDRPTVRAALRLGPAVFKLAGWLRRGRFDLVHTNTVKAHLLGGPAARIALVPCVMHLRDILDGMGGRTLRAAALTCAKERIAISNSVARHYALPVTTTIYNPVDLDLYGTLPTRSEARRKLGLPLDGVIVGVVGRIARWKRHDLLLRAVARVRSQHPMHCVIVGEPRFEGREFYEELQALVARLGIGDSVTFVPWLDDPRVAFAAMDVHVNSSLAEPFGRTIVEAAAAGVPSICFNDAGVAEIMDHDVTGKVVAANDEDAFYAALREYVADAALRERSANAALLWSTRFDVHRHAVNIGQILRRAAKPSRTAS